MNDPDVPSIRTLIATFDLPLRAHQIGRWRGAFVAAAGRELDLLHNHQPEAGVIYRYPLVQYRVRQGRAAIFALNEGALALHQGLATSEGTFLWEGQPRRLRLDQLVLREYPLTPLPVARRYQLHRWVAFNAKSFQHWQDAPGLPERLSLLQQVLARQIAAFAGAMGYPLTTPPEVTIQALKRQGWVRVHGSHLLAFDLVYETPLALPPLIALGKATSLGYGWQVPVR